MGVRLIVVIILMAACAPATTSATPSPTPTPTPTPSPSPSPAIGDACLVGRWVDQKQSAPGNWTWSNERIAVSGLQGFVITYTAAGLETDDFSAAQPLVGDFHGHQIKIALGGLLTYQVLADGSHIVQSNAAGSLTGTYYYDGVVQPGGTATAPAGTIAYTCSGNTLHLESPAGDPAYGPQLDDLTRG